MTQAITLLLSLAGGACACYSLLRGDGLRAENDRLAQRLTPRVLLALALLACAIVGSAVHALQASASLIGLTWMVPVMLAAGVGSLLMAVSAAPVRHGEETISDRFTPHGKLALGLLAGAFVLGLLAGPGATVVNRLEDLGETTTPLLVGLGLALAVPGMAVLAGVLHSGRVFLPGEGPRLVRLTPQARAAGSLLTLALEVVGLAAWMAPQSGVVVALVLLVMGMLAGLRAVIVDGKTARAAGRLRLSPRGLAALGLLGGAVVVLGFQVKAGSDEPATSAGVLAGQVQANQALSPADKPPEKSVYMLRHNYGHEVNVIDKARDLRIQLRDREEELAAEKAKSKKADDDRKANKSTSPMGN